LLIVLSRLPRVGANIKTRTGDAGRPRATRRVEPEPRAAESANAQQTPRSSRPSAARESAVPVEREPVTANGPRTEEHVAATRAKSPEDRGTTAATL